MITSVPAAAAPPVPDPALLPPAGEAAPPAATEQRNLCTAVVPIGDVPQMPHPQRSLDFASVWPLTRGAGQTVAVIDTGVARHPRLPDPIPGGDYVSTGDGTDDCDAHGTLVAGLIAAQPVDGSGFAGGAPDVELITIRQSSRNFSDRTHRGDDETARNSTGYGDVRTMALAVRRAADLGATVINISEVACKPVSEVLGDGSLGAAVQYATDIKDAVVVAAAGNISELCKPSNPAGADPLRPDADPWEHITTLATPAWYDDYVLTVGSVEEDGVPSDYSLPGPWVDVAAPGSAVTSLDPDSGGSTDRYSGANGPEPISGTSFAAPLVAATVALVRARHPHLDARAVMDRVESTAHAPAEGWNPRVGHGVVDPLAAVTAPLPAQRELVFASVPLPAPTPVPPPDRRPRIVALVASGAVCGALVLAVLLSMPLRRRMRSFPPHPPARTDAGR
ncbi:type VII secretion-associated serine protease mycosin [Rhodococcus sp. CC-R104]|uniref:Type VII secretion-associated serine protease mycosin n=2 Tax=Rhodococcus chondri TaxID=3065941 RepID=A0ABU7JW38_9NOCA|nr:type VII secretion-associated serine protease mycosin [Rhodococcus sp. CC-R104]MEE2034235.1 type VII secretion-associated serine protease mycosin [Rhodococcus sp. CC-R104]